MAGDYANSWTARNEPSEINSLNIRTIFSKWCPPKKWGMDSPCWQDDMRKPPQVPYSYSEYSSTNGTGRKCPVKEGTPWMPHIAPETCNLFEDHFSDDGNCITHWCSDANVTRTELGVLEFLNRQMDSDVEDFPIFHIVVNTHDWDPGEISLDLAFPSKSYYSHNLQVQGTRFADDTLFVGEYRKGKMRYQSTTHGNLGQYHDVCEDCWYTDSHSMRVYSDGNYRLNSNGRRGTSQPISMKDVKSAVRRGNSWIDYEFSLIKTNNTKLKISISTEIIEDLINAKWNKSPLRIFPPLG